MSGLETRQGRHSCVHECPGIRPSARTRSGSNKTEAYWNYTLCCAVAARFLLQTGTSSSPVSFSRVVNNPILMWIIPYEQYDTLVATLDPT